MRRLRVLLVCAALMGLGIAFGAARNGLWGSGGLWSLGFFGGDHDVERHAAWDSDGDEFDWSGALAVGDELEIKGINGSIRAVSTGGDARVEADKEGRGAEEVHIEVVEHSRGVTICAIYPSEDGSNICEPGSGGRNSVKDNRARVDFEVEVPEGVRFTAVTVNGSVEAEGLAGFADLRTVNGDIEVESTQGARGATVNGSINAVLGADWTQDVSLETVNGSIEVDVEDDHGAEVDVSWVNGSLEVEPPLALRGKLSRRSARGALGEGGPELELRTVNGSVRIHE